MAVPAHQPRVPPSPDASVWKVEVQGVSRSFGTTIALRQVTLQVAPGQIHALLGPNGAGKTTLLRILAGLTDPTSGTVRVCGLDPVGGGQATQRFVGLIPGGDRTFYLRLSGLENLIFFGRLYDMRHREAAARAREVLGQVDLAGAGQLPVGKYSHGMQKRLAIARALLPRPPVLLADEATHDLDPEGARRVRDLVRGAAAQGTAVVWATQRVDEIRGFADAVTLLARGEVRFAGTVPQLMTHSSSRRYLLRVRDGRPGAVIPDGALQQAVGAWGEIGLAQAGDGEHYLLRLGDDAILGEVITALTAARFQVLSCQEAQPEIEEAVLYLTREGLR